MHTYRQTLNQSHVLFKAQRDVLDICKPLFDYLGIEYFHFRRTFKNGSYLVLATNGLWPSYFIKQNIPVSTPMAQHFFDSDSYFCLWRGHIPDEVLSVASNSYGIKNAIAMVERRKDYFDSYSFASKIHGEFANDIYINNIELFLKFIPYFHEKAVLLVREATRQLIVPPELLKDVNLHAIMNFQAHNDKKRKFINSIMLNEAPLKSRIGTIILTKRELECLFHLSHGKNRKEIALLIGLSPRTVDTHLEKAKNKLGCFTTSELIDIWWANQF